MPELVLEQILQGRESQPSQLIEVLHDIQESLGHVCQESMEEVSKCLGVPFIEVFRVASFYKTFRLQPCGKHVLTVCTGTACHVRGAQMLLDQATSQLGVGLNEISSDGMFSVEHVNCVGACALGPIINENKKYHHHMTPAKVRSLIKKLRNKESGGKLDASTE